MIFTFTLFTGIVWRFVAVLVAVAIFGKWMLSTFDQFPLCLHAETLPCLALACEMADLIGDDSSLLVTRETRI